MTGQRLGERKALRVLRWLSRPTVTRSHIAVAVLVVVALGFSTAWLLFRSNVFTVQAVEVGGTTRLRPAAIVAAADVDSGSSLLTLDTEAVANRVGKIPAVRRVEVVRSWPRTVEIAIEERTPVAARREGKSYVLVDASGVAFDRVRKRPKGLSLISAPTGVDATGRTRPEDRVALRAALEVLGHLGEPVRQQVIEVRAYAADDVTLRLTKGRTVIWGSPDRGERKATVLAALVTRKAKVYNVSAPDTPTTRK